MDTFGHQLPRHALGQPRLGVACHRKGAAQRKASEPRACIREDNRAPHATGVWLVATHLAGRLLANEKSAERQIADGIEHQTRLHVGDRLPNDARTLATDVVNDERWAPKLCGHAPKQTVYGVRITGVARIPQHTVGFLKSL